MTNLVKLVWLIACLGVLAYTLVACGQEPNSTLRGECSLLAAIMMAFLTFPLGLLWWLLVSAAGYAFSLVGIQFGGASVVADLVVWLGFVVLGFLQWFKLLPFLVRRVRERKKATI
jgi:hypothetical protein